MTAERVVHLTTVHQRRDVRIFHKECLSLARAGWDVHLVVADGLTPPVPGGTERLVQVRRASGGADGLVGVVTGRMVFDLAPGKEDEGARSLQSADGPARAGDYVALVVLGVAEVRVAPGASIAKGARLTVDATGAARPLRTESLNGMVVAEGAPTIGTALASASGGTVPVFISLR